MSSAIMQVALKSSGNGFHAMPLNLGNQFGIYV